MNFLKSVVTYSAATIISRSGQVAMLIVFPFLLSPAQYGVLGLFIAIAALVNLLPLEITQGLARHLSDADQMDKNSYSATAWSFTLAMLIAAGIVAGIFAPTLNRLVTGDADLLPIFYAGLGYFVMTTALYFTQAQFRWEMRPREFFLASIGQALLAFGFALAGALLLTDRLLGVVLGQAAGLALVFFWSAWRLRQSLLARFDRTKLVSMLRFSLPLVPGSLAIFLGIYAARLVLNDKMPLAEVGVFTFASQIAAIPGLTILGVQAALTPYVLKHHREAETPELVGRLFELVAAGGLLLTLIFGLGAGPLIAMFGNSDYDGAGALVIVLVPAYLLQMLYVFGPGFMIASRTFEQMWVSIVGGGAAVGFSYWFIAEFGLIGAALATLASAALFLASWLVLAGRYYPIAVRWTQIAIAVALTIGLAALAWPYGPGVRALAILLAFPAFWILGLSNVGVIRRLQR